jgi:hypothetical protein
VKKWAAYVLFCLVIIVLVSCSAPAASDTIQVDRVHLYDTGSTSVYEDMATGNLIYIGYESMSVVTPQELSGGQILRLMKLGYKTVTP